MMFGRASAVCGLVAFLAIALQASAAGSDIATTESAGRQLQQANRPFRVIAFGDSTTEGWVPKLKKFVPYTITLDAMLKQRFSSRKRQAQVVNSGLGFSTVLGKGGRPAILPYCRKKLAEAKAKGIVYDWVIMWIGQNDLLALDAKADGLMSLLRPWFVEVLNGGSNLLLVTPVNYKQIPKTDPKEAQLKRLAALYQSFTVQGNANLKKRKSPRRIRFINLRAAGFNPYVTSQAKYNSLFDDFHLSDGGYRTLGRLAFQQMFK